MNDSPGYITRMNTGREEILKHAVLTVSQALQRNCDVDFNSNLPKCKYNIFCEEMEITLIIKNQKQNQNLNLKT